MSMLTMKVTSGGVPPGAYTAKFVGLEEVPPDAARGFGAGVKWQFEVAAGPNTGGKASRITTATPSLKNACGKMLAGLLGKPLAADQQADLAPLVGRTFLIVVAPTDTGGSRVETVSAPPV